jgi:hypothetical protein
LCDEFSEVTPGGSKAFNALERVLLLVDESLGDEAQIDALDFRRDACGVDDCQSGSSCVGFLGVAPSSIPSPPLFLPRQWIKGFEF